MKFSKVHVSLHFGVICAMRVAKQIFDKYDFDLVMTGHKSSHCLRKYGARKIYENYSGKGEGLELLRMMLAHSTLAMTRKYTLEYKRKKLIHFMLWLVDS